jgi:hypothetical protein
MELIKRDLERDREREDRNGTTEYNDGTTRIGWRDLEKNAVNLAENIAFTLAGEEAYQYVSQFFVKYPADKFRN